MKYQNPQEMRAADLVQSLDGIQPMSRHERLTRWADALESHAGPLNALRRIEYLSADEQRQYSGINTPLTVAFNEPSLSAEGLASDRLGDTMDFFGMTADEAHHLFCDCHYMGSMTGAGLARRLRSYAEDRGPSVWRRLGAMLA
ncbi:hypothetical protein [Devosia sp. A369]